MGPGQGDRFVFVMTSLALVFALSSLCLNQFGLFALSERAIPCGGFPAGR